MPLTWSQDFEFGIKVIDQQHHQLVDTIQTLLADLGNSRLPQTVEKVFSALDNYAQYHFRTEEDYFKRFHYQASSEHVTAHQQFRQKLADIKLQYQTNQIQAGFDLADFLEDWLLDHLLNMDRKYVACFKQNGL